MRYVLYPGFIISKDGDEHYISASRLVRLYGVDPFQYEVVISAPYGTRLQPGDIALYPREDGNYVLPTNGV